MLGISFIFGHIFVLPHPALNSSYWHLGRAECEVKIHLVVGRTYECMRKKKRFVDTLQPIANLKLSTDSLIMTWS